VLNIFFSPYLSNLMLNNCKQNQIETFLVSANWNLSWANLHNSTSLTCENKRWGWRINFNARSSHLHWCAWSIIKSIVSKQMHTKYQVEVVCNRIKNGHSRSQSIACIDHNHGSSSMLSPRSDLRNFITYN